MSYQRLSTKCKSKLRKQVHNKIVITKKQIVQILSNLDTSKACGPDNIGNLILKTLPSLSKSLYLVFKTVIAKGFFPIYWKISELVPIFKDAKKTQIEKYWPRNLLCNVTKILEKLIFDELYNLINKHLHEAQHGFCKM